MLAMCRGRLRSFLQQAHDQLEFCLVRNVLVFKLVLNHLVELRLVSIDGFNSSLILQGLKPLPLNQLLVLDAQQQVFSA